MIHSIAFFSVTPDIYHNICVVKTKPKLFRRSVMFRIFQTSNLDSHNPEKKIHNKLKSCAFLGWAFVEVTAYFALKG